MPSEGEIEDELRSMGYSSEQAKQAFQVANGDLEQAVCFLLMNDESRRGFMAVNLEDSFSFPSLAGHGEDGDDDAAAAAATATAAATAGSRTNNPTNGAHHPGKNRDIEEIMQMGYGSSQAIHALEVAQGDVNQAVSFLLMGESRNGFVTNEEVNDAALATALQQEYFQQQQQQQPHHRVRNSLPGVAAAAAGAGNHMNSRPSLSSINIPRMVAAPMSLLTIPEGGRASAFCSAVAASKFLRGGTVNGQFLESVLQSGVETMLREEQALGIRRDSDDDYWRVDLVFQQCGKQFLGITTILDERKGEPKTGVFLRHDVQHTLGIRKLMATCRNEQTGQNWQILILEASRESFCICLPPKGSVNKFWYFDFKPRAMFRVPGAYARVHTSMLQLVESLESVFESFGDKEYHSFVLFTVLKLT